MNKLKLSYSTTIFSVIFLLLQSTYTLADDPEAVTSAMLTSMEGKVQFADARGREADFGVDLLQGDVLTTDADSSIVITYYSGCRQEWIGANSRVEIGKNKSNVIKGKISRIATFDCEIPKPQLTTDDSYRKAGYNFRGVKKKLKQTTDQSLNKDGVKFKLWTSKMNNPYYQVGEKVVIYYVANQDAYIKLDYYQHDGMVKHLIPNFLPSDKLIAGKVYVLGNKNSKPDLTIDSPFQTEVIKALVSTKPFTRTSIPKKQVESAYNYDKVVSSLEKKDTVSSYSTEIWTTP